MKQLNLFDTPLEQPLLKMGDKVRCPDGEGRVYWINGYIWVSIGNTARPYNAEEVSRVE